ncbi:hypothetical protein AU375_04773 [Methylobacterium radiotolerans]|nr:hypothetical protein AU375_04773 [Methylobacterium radiotolerans]
MPVGQTFETLRRFAQRRSGMCDEDEPFTNEQLTELALTQAGCIAQAGKALEATAHQAVAGLVVNALLLHELGRLGLVDPEALRTEAIARARSIKPPDVGASVSRVIEAILDGGGRIKADEDFASDDGHPSKAKH